MIFTLIQVGERKLVLKKEESSLSVRMFSGFHETRQFSAKIRLKAGMFDDHIPQGYNAPFSSKLLKNITLQLGSSSTILTSLFENKCVCESMFVNKTK